MKRLVTIAFWRLQHSFGYFGGGLPAWKALTVLCCTAIFMCFAAYALVTLVVGCQFLPEARNPAFLAGLGVGVWVLFGWAMPWLEKSLATYEKEFASWTNRLRFLATFMTFGAALLSLVVMVLLLNLSKTAAPVRCEIVRPSQIIPGT